MNLPDLTRRASLTAVFFLVASQLASADSGKPADSLELSMVAYDPFNLYAESPDEVIPLTLDIGTLMVGHQVNHCIGGPSVVYGYASGVLGSYSPTGLTGGTTVDEVADITPSGACVAAHSMLNVTGFSSNPGSSWLNSVTCNGVKNLGSSAIFGYSSGLASWEWSQLFGLSSKVGLNVSCTIDHN